MNNGKTYPTGIWYIVGSFIFLTAALGSVNSVLILYLTNVMHYSQKDAFPIYAAFNSMLFTIPILEGYIGEKFGYKETTAVGILFCLAGMLSLLTSSTIGLYFGLACVAIGVATTTTTFSVLVDMCYHKNDTRRESGFTMYYVLFNLGFFLAPIATGFISQKYGYHMAFSMVAVGLVISIAFFLATQSQIVAAPERCSEPQLKLTKPVLYAGVVGINLVTALVVTFLLDSVTINNALLWVLAVGTSVGIIIQAFRFKDKIARYKLLAFLALCIIAIAFWTLYMLESSLLTLFIQNNVDRHIFGTTWPASVYYSLDAAFVIPIGLILTWMWHSLAEKGKDLSLPSKFALSLLVMGSGYLVVRLGIDFSSNLHLTNSLWIVLGYFFFALAEMLISPIGLSMVGRLSPDGSEGILMGVWQLFIGFSAVVSGYVGEAISIPQKSLAPILSNPIYARGFTHVGLTTITAGVVAVLLIVPIKRLISDKKSG